MVFRWDNIIFYQCEHHIKIVLVLLYLLKVNNNKYGCENFQQLYVRESYKTYCWSHKYLKNGILSMEINNTR